MSLTSNTRTIEELLEMANNLPDAGEGSAELPELTNPAAAEQVVEGYDAINADGEVVIGTNPYEKTTTDAEVTTQASLIEQIRAVLQEKAAGSGGGDTTVEDGLITRTLTEYSNDRITELGSYAFYTFASLTSLLLPNITTAGSYAIRACTSLTAVDFPLLASSGTYLLYGCTVLSDVNLPALTAVNMACFQNCKAIVKLDFPVAKSIAAHAFNGTALATLILRKSDAIVTLGNTNAFTSTPIASGTGYVYVPDDLVDSYKSATNWSTYADQIKPISELEVTAE